MTTLKTASFIDFFETLPGPIEDNQKPLPSDGVLAITFPHASNEELVTEIFNGDTLVNTIVGEGTGVVSITLKQNSGDPDFIYTGTTLKVSASGATRVRVSRMTDIDQTQEFKTEADLSFPTRVATDKLTRIAQEQGDKLDRALKLGVDSEATLKDLEPPANEDILQFERDGDIITPVSKSLAALVGDDPRYQGGGIIRLYAVVKHSDSGEFVRKLMPNTDYPAEVDIVRFVPQTGANLINMEDDSIVVGWVNPGDQDDPDNVPATTDENQITLKEVEDGTTDDLKKIPTDRKFQAKNIDNKFFSGWWTERNKIPATYFKRTDLFDICYIETHYNPATQAGSALTRSVWSDPPTKLDAEQVLTVLQRVVTEKRFPKAFFQQYSSVREGVSLPASSDADEVAKVKAAYLTRIAQTVTDARGHIERWKNAVSGRTVPTEPVNPNPTASVISDGGVLYIRKGANNTAGRNDHLIQPDSTLSIPLSAGRLPVDGLRLDPFKPFEVTWDGLITGKADIQEAGETKAQLLVALRTVHTFYTDDTKKRTFDILSNTQYDPVEVYQNEVFKINFGSARSTTLFSEVIKNINSIEGFIDRFVGVRYYLDITGVHTLADIQFVPKVLTGNAANFIKNTTEEVPEYVAGNTANAPNNRKVDLRIFDLSILNLNVVHNQEADVIRMGDASAILQSTIDDRVARNVRRITNPLTGFPAGEEAGAVALSEKAVEDTDAARDKALIAAASRRFVFYVVRKSTTGRGENYFGINYSDNTFSALYTPPTDTEPEKITSDDQRLLPSEDTPPKPPLHTFHATRPTRQEGYTVDVYMGTYRVDRVDGIGGTVSTGGTLLFSYGKEIDDAETASEDAAGKIAEIDANVRGVEFFYGRINMNGDVSLVNASSGTDVDQYNKVSKKLLLNYRISTSPSVKRNTDFEMTGPGGAGRLFVAAVEVPPEGLANIPDITPGTNIGRVIVHSIFEVPAGEFDVSLFMAVPDDKRRRNRPAAPTGGTGAGEVSYTGSAFNATSYDGVRADGTNISGAAIDEDKLRGGLSDAEKTAISNALNPTLYKWYPSTNVPAAWSGRDDVIDIYKTSARYKPSAPVTDLTFMAPRLNEADVGPEPSDDRLNMLIDPLIDADLNTRLDGAIQTVLDKDANKQSFRDVVKVTTLPGGVQTPTGTIGDVVLLTQKWMENTIGLYQIVADNNYFEATIQEPPSRAGVGKSLEVFESNPKTALVGIEWLDSAEAFLMFVRKGYAGPNPPAHYYLMVTEVKASDSNSFTALTPSQQANSRIGLSRNTAEDRAGFWAYSANAAAYRFAKGRWNLARGTTLKWQIFSSSATDSNQRYQQSNNIITANSRHWSPFGESKEEIDGKFQHLNEELTGEINKNKLDIAANKTDITNNKTAAASNLTKITALEGNRLEVKSGLNLSPSNTADYIAIIKADKVDRIVPLSGGKIPSSLLPAQSGGGLDVSDNLLNANLTATANTYVIANLNQSIFTTVNNRRRFRFKQLFFVSDRNTDLNYRYNNQALMKPYENSLITSPSEIFLSFFDHDGQATISNSVLLFTIRNVGTSMRVYSYSVQRIVTGIYGIN